MEKLGTIKAIQVWRDRIGSESVGFVPTMGALHEGHMQLIRASLAENKHTLVSIFVNPTQFNDPKDITGYPTPLQTDLMECEGAGVSAVFLPQYGMMYYPTAKPGNRPGRLV